MLNGRTHSVIDVHGPKDEIFFFASLFPPLVTSERTISKIENRIKIKERLSTMIFSGIELLVN